MNHPIPFPDEVAHLSDIRAKLEAALSKADCSVQALDSAYMDAKRYMAQYRGEIDPHEMFQNELALRQVDRSGAFAVALRNRIEKLTDSPYFARIDFQQDGKTTPYYIGRYSFTHENALLVLDWRAPIASIFYDDEIGPVAYDAPSGRIEGTLTRKRQFKIKNGKLEYALETSAHVQDDVLLKELSSTSDEKMKSIIATIQKEQNQIIRDEKAGTLIIQGVAGSGKTSIALHRIAFLLYRFKDKLTAQNVAIISPNKVFGNYISTVLPELGEEPIGELRFADIADIQLEGVIGFEAEKNALETSDAEWMKRAAYKSTPGFVKEMDAFIARLSDIAFAAADYTYAPFSVSAAWIAARMNAYGRHPLKRRLSMIADDIHSRFMTDNIMEHEVPRQTTILKGLRAMLHYKSTLPLYKRFIKENGLAKMMIMPDKKTLEWSDVFPFLYLHAAFEGLKESKMIRHLVIDEMQDYTPIQFAVINQLFQCEKTILGDFRQSIHINHSHTLDDLMQLYPGAKLVKLNKSYRSTYEIIDFARQIQQADDMEMMERHGPVPTITGYASKQQAVQQIRKHLNDFPKSTTKTLGIIVKTNSRAQQLYEELQDVIGITLITPNSKAFESGISITSVQMSKGLEFDEVLIPDADSQTYTTEHDRSLLYVACTRAMHRLHLFYQGEKSPLLPNA